MARGACSLCCGLCCLPCRIAKWAATLAGVWVACILGIFLSFYGFTKTKRNAVRAPARTTTGLEDKAMPTISVVIPTRNEVASIAATIKHTVTNATNPEAMNIVVVDGSSSDGTADAARALGTTLGSPVTVFTAASSRGGALNRGAAESRGDIIVFLHADTLLPRGFDKLVRDCVRDASVVAGAFKFGVNRDSFVTSCPVGVGTMEGFANFRAINFLLPYGDQAMFMTRGRYEQCGPFPDTKMMEDFELTRRLRLQAIREGGRYPILAATALCDGRRWEMNGVLWNTLLNQVFVFMYTSMGYSAEQIYDLYYARRGS